MAGTKATIEVPEGMTAEKLLALVQGYEEKREKNKTVGKAKRAAVQALIKAHKDEYEAVLKKNMPK